MVHFFFQRKTNYEVQNYPRGITYHPKRKELIVCLNANISKQSDRRNTIISYKHDEGWPTVKNAPKETREHLECPYRVEGCQRSGDIFVSDFARKSIVVMDENMNFKFEISCDYFPVTYNGVPSYTLDKRGRLFIFDDVVSSATLRVLNTDGLTQQKYDVGVRANFNLSLVAMDTRDRLWVACGMRIRIFQF